MQKGLGQWGPRGRGRQGVKKGGVAQKQHPTLSPWQRSECLLTQALCPHCPCK